MSPRSSSRPRTHARAGALVLLGVVWILVNGPVEGPTLLVLGGGHGLTTADLLSVAAFTAAAWLELRERRQTGACPSPDEDRRAQDTASLG